MSKSIDGAYAVREVVTGPHGVEAIRWHERMSGKPLTEKAASELCAYLRARETVGARPVRRSYRVMPAAVREQALGAYAEAVLSA